MMQQTWDSRSIDPRDRVETIRTMLCENLVQTDLTLDPQGREAHVNVSYQDIGQLRALSVKTVPSLAALAMRPQRMIMSDDDESLFVVFQRGNRSMLRRGDDQTVMTPGSIVVYPSTSPYVHAFDEGVIGDFFRLPLGVVGLTADQIGEVSGVDLRERTSLAALLQSVLGGVMDSELSLRDEVDVFAPVADLLKVTLLSALTPDRATTRYPLAEQIVTYVLDNLTDPGLGAARIAKDLHVSERLLYAEMSRADIRLAQLIQSQRLRRVRDALTAPATIDVPIGVLAQQHGFVSASHFSRIFREEFGTTPRQWRNNTTPRPDEIQDESRLDLPKQIRPEETYG